MTAKKLSSGTKFREKCLKENLTARDVAKKTGLSIHTIHAYFQGTRSPSAPTRKLFREKLNIETKDIFD